MKIVIVSIALNIHQIGIADELWNLTKGKFRFIEIKDAGENQNKGINEDFSERPYLIRTSNSQASMNLAIKLIKEADVMIYGAAPLFYLKERVKTGKLTFINSERWLKKGLVNLLSPNLIKQQLYYHVFCNGKPVYALCSSAYAKEDYVKLHSFREKCFKWGYFTQCEKLNIEEIIIEKRKYDKIRILWCGRFISWKHPEVMISLAEKLLNIGIDFQINMIGTGTLFNKIFLEIQQKGLNNHIKLLGSLPNKEVIRTIDTHHIACFTSDRNEGWGAVLNEAMSRGCCPVSSIETGSTPYLINEGVNGFSFALKNKNDFFNKVLWLIQHPDEREKMSIEAYNTIINVWNPHNAAKCLYALCEELLNLRFSSKKDLFIGGPCSKA